MIYKSILVNKMESEKKSVRITEHRIKEVVTDENKDEIFQRIVNECLESSDDDNDNISSSHSCCPDNNDINDNNGDNSGDTPSEQMNLMFSGGSVGADIEWASVATKNGHSVIHYLPTNTRSTNGYSKIDGELRILTAHESLQGHQFVMKANQVLRRTYPSKSKHTNDLLRRSFWQIAKSDSLYAVGVIKKVPYPDSPSRIAQIQGSPAWAVQMMIDKYTELLYSNVPQNRNTVWPIPVFFFDQDQEKWLQYHIIFMNDGGSCKILLIDGKWEETNNVPIPSGSYTAIGTRNLNDRGREAIHSIYG